MLDRWVCSQAGISFPLERDEIEAWQLEKLNKTIDRAVNCSTFYAERLKGIRVSSLEEFSRIPFTYTDDLRKYGGEMLAFPSRDIKRIVTAPTSGSTGSPKRVFFSRDDIEETVDFFAHGLNEFVNEGDRALLLFPGNSPDGMNDLIIRALHRLGCEGFFFGYPDESRYGEMVERIIDERITFLIGTAKSMAEAARYSRKAGKDGVVSECVHGVLTAAAYVPEADRADICRIWKCRADEYYGMTETGYMGAVGCSATGGYHIWESGLYLEIVDPLTGEVLPDGAEGEVVVTTLTERAMPFIRYRTGDISRIVPGKCSCGSSLRRLARVHERPYGKKFERRNITVALS